MRDITENRMRYNMQLESFQDARATGPPTIFPSELMSNILVRSNVDITKVRFYFIHYLHRISFCEIANCAPAASIPRKLTAFDATF